LIKTILNSFILNLLYILKEMKFSKTCKWLKLIKGTHLRDVLHVVDLMLFKRHEFLVVIHAAVHAL